MILVLDNTDRNLFKFVSFVWLGLISTMIIYYNLEQNIHASIIIGFLIVAVGFVLIFIVKMRLEKDE